MSLTFFKLPLNFKLTCNFKFKLTRNLKLNFKLTRMLTIFVDYFIDIGSYTIMAKPIKSLELHYPMIQFLIINSYSSRTRRI